MATAILSSQNSLTHRFDHDTLIHRNPNSRLTRRSNAATSAPRRRKKSSAASRSTTVVDSPAAKTNLVMGQVKILKRGETLSAFMNKETNSCSDRDVLRINDIDLIVASTNNRLGPEPEILKKQIGAFKGIDIVSGDYAGVGCSVSPPPSSVPIPCFLGKNKFSV